MNTSAEMNTEITDEMEKNNTEIFFEEIYKEMIMPYIYTKKEEEEIKRKIKEEIKDIVYKYKYFYISY